MNHGLGWVEKSLCGGLDLFKLALRDLRLTSQFGRLVWQKQRESACVSSVYVVHDVWEFSRPIIL